MHTMATVTARPARSARMPGEVSVVTCATAFFGDKLTFHLRGRDSRAAARGRCARRMFGPR
jgi:hypothetical protein